VVGNSVRFGIDKEQLSKATPKTVPRNEKCTATQKRKHAIDVVF
jgi:hypothetical protein